MVLDRGLIDKCITVAGGANIHDVRGCASIYLNCVENYNKGINLGMDKEFTDRQLYLALVYERILLSFLVTRDIKESKSIIKKSLGEIE